MVHESEKAATSRQIPDLSAGETEAGDELTTVGTEFGISKTHPVAARKPGLFSWRAEGFQRRLSAIANRMPAACSASRRPVGVRPR